MCCWVLDRGVPHSHPPSPASVPGGVSAAGTLCRGVSFARILCKLVTRTGPAAQLASCCCVVVIAGIATRTVPSSHRDLQQPALGCAAVAIYVHLHLGQPPTSPDREGLKGCRGSVVPLGVRLRNIRRRSQLVSSRATPGQCIACSSAAAGHHPMRSARAWQIPQRGFACGPSSVGCAHALCAAVYAAAGGPRQQQQPALSAGSVA